jgi:hypothetical protein
MAWTVPVCVSRPLARTAMPSATYQSPEWRRQASAAASAERRASALSPSRSLASACAPRMAPRSWPSAPQASPRSPEDTTPGRSLASSAFVADDSVGGAHRLEPLAGELVAELLVFFREHRVRRVAEERMAERVLVFPLELRLAVSRDDLAVHEQVEVLAHLGRERVAPEERDRAAAPEDGPEHARRAEHATRLAVETLKARLRHREDRLGHGVAAVLGHGSDELLEIEGVAAAPLHDARDRRRVRTLAQDAPDELLAGAPRQLGQGELEHPSLDPQMRKQASHLGSRQRQHEERASTNVAERRVDEQDRGRISPVQVLEDDHDGMRPALALHEVLESATDLIVHENRVTPSGAERLVVRVVEGSAHHLAEELGDARPVLGRDAPRDASP